MVLENSESSTQKFCSHKILSLGNENRWVVLISMLWHEDAKTGSWAMKCAKNVVSFEGLTSERSSTKSDYEFASISTREDKEVSSFKKKTEMIVSSKFCLHVSLPILVVSLSRSQYLCFFNLLNQVMDALGNLGSETSVSQSCVLLDCGLVEIHIELDLEDSPKGSLERELPGSWQRLKLKIHKFQLLSVSDVGAMSGAHFLWISHNEGKLWGSITSMEDQDILLISCCDSSKGRGDGEGSNVLSSTDAGFDFVLTFDSESFHNFMSITLKCMTIVAHGGRLDWVDKIISFFSLPSREVVDCNEKKEVSEKLSFIVKFIDGALSYEPYSSGTNGKFIAPKSTTSSSLDESDPCISSLLAASCFTILSTTENVYNIKFRDAGFLLHEVSEKTRVVGDYSVNYLREPRYVKIAGESLLNAILRVNCENDVFWELNCSESHIDLSTCHDTTLGLMRLASQIQDLFAPDMEESLVHLQNRWKWNSLKHVNLEEEGKGVSESSSNSSQRSFQTDTKVEAGLLSLMGEISEDAFLFVGNSTNSFDWSKPNTSDKNEGLFNEGHGFLYPCENSMHDGNLSILDEPEIVEGYCLSDLRSLSELTINSHFPESNSVSSFESKGNVDVQRVKSGWYGSTSLNIFENYVPDRTGLLDSKQDSESHQNYEEDNNGGRKFKGRILLKSIDVEWRLFGGSDWHDLKKDVENSGKTCGRDESVCLELALSNMNIRYDIFPEGDLCVSKMSLSIEDLYLYDRSSNAPWKLV